MPKYYNTSIDNTPKVQPKRPVIYLYDLSSPTFRKLLQENQENNENKKKINVKIGG
jgi:hypothetical protein